MGPHTLKHCSETLLCWAPPAPRPCCAVRGLQAQQPHRQVWHQQPRPGRQALHLSRPREGRLRHLQASMAEGRGQTVALSDGSLAAGEAARCWTATGPEHRSPPLPNYQLRQPPLQQTCEHTVHWHNQAPLCPPSRCPPHPLWCAPARLPCLQPGPHHRQPRQQHGPPDAVQQAGHRLRHIWQLPPPGRPGLRRPRPGCGRLGLTGLPGCAMAVAGLIGLPVPAGLPEACSLWGTAATLTSRC